MAGGLAGEDPIRADRQTPKGKRRWVLTAAGLEGRAGEGGRDGRSYTFIRFRAGKEGKFFLKLLSASRGPWTKRAT